MKEKLTAGEIIIYIIEGLLMMGNLLLALMEFVLGSAKGGIFFIISAALISPVLGSNLRKIEIFHKNIIGMLGLQFLISTFFGLGGILSTPASEKKEEESSRMAIIMETEENTTEIETESPAEEIITEIETESLTEEITTEIETDEIATNQLYLDFFEPYADSVGTLLLQGFQESGSEKFKNYDVEITEGNEEDEWKYKIYDKNSDDYITIWFFPENVMDNSSDWIWSLTLITYEKKDKEISVSDNTHIQKPEYHIFNKVTKDSNKDMKNLDELKNFLFSESIETDTTEMETETEIPTTEPVTEPVTEAPTLPPTEPPATQAPAPVVISQEYWINTDSGKFHLSTCRTIKNREEPHWQIYSGDRNDLIGQGYDPCGVCHP